MNGRITPRHYAEALLRLGAEGTEPRLLAAAVDRIAEELRRAGRGAWLPRILAEVERLSAAAEGRRSVTVTSAEPLAADDRAAMAEALGVGAKTMDMLEYYDQSLWAGIRISAGDRTVAHSVRDRLDKLFPK